MKKKKTTKGTKRTILIYLLILVVLYVVIYIVPQVSDIFVETYTAEYNTLQVTDKATCLFVRNEKTYTADSGGPVNREVKEGRLMREGAHIVDVGNTVLVIEHNLDVIKTADYLIDLGPEGGDEGGYVVAEGTPEQIAAAPGSYTGKYLASYLEKT